MPRLRSDAHSLYASAGCWSGHHAPSCRLQSECDPTVTNGPPRTICLEFRVNNGRLIGPADMFDDPAFDPVRRRGFELAEMLRGHGPFESHRIPVSGTEPGLSSPDQRLRTGWEPLS